MDVCANWNGHGGHGHWPDMDMLPIGRLSVGHRSVGADRPTHFTHAEQLTLLTLWSIFPSPLMLGGDFTAADPWEISLLSNDEVLAVNQDSLGQPAMRGFNHKGLEVWQRNLADGRIAVALFNRTEDDTTVSATWADLDLRGKYQARDLWQRKDLGSVEGKIEMPIPSHGAAMVTLAQQK
jgi:alpha-galactosidase